MGLTTALFSSLSGMNTSSQAINVSGNNIANVNTTGFKTSRISFETQFSQSLSDGSGPSDTLGGTNPVQIGLGVRVAGVSRDFTGGSLQPTGVNTDLAVEGAGFFILESLGNTRYTRDGSFSLDESFNLVSSAGGRVQGYGVDEDFNIVGGTLRAINVPLGTLTLAEATRTVRFAGNINAGGDTATIGALITADPLFADAGAAAFADAGTALTSLFSGAGDALFANGDVVTVTGVQKGGATLPNHTFEVGAANTTASDTNGTSLGDLLTFLQDIFGIDTAIGGGVGVNNGVLTIEGNLGTGNDLVVNNGSIVVNQSTNPSLPFNFVKQQAADGESVRTTFVAFDSLGTPLVVDLTMVLEEKVNSGTTWRFYFQSEDDTDLNRAMGTGTITFDNDGQIVTTSDARFVIDRANTGALAQQEVIVEFSGSQGGLSALSSTTSQIAAVSQDGSPIGTLEDFSVAEDGAIVGIFSNSLIRNLGRIALANFPNTQGLEDLGGNLFRGTVNSGLASIVAPGTAGTGRIVGGALELSNVDLSKEFINLITASTGFTANSRVLSTSDRLIQELLAVIR